MEGRQPNELLRLKFENNMLRTEVAGLQYKEQFNKTMQQLQVERKQLLEEMRKEVNASPSDLYDVNSHTFVSKE